MQKYKKLQDRIAALKTHCGRNDFDEAATKQFYILPILDALGWEAFSISPIFIYPEYRLDEFRVDYALLDKNTPLVLIEAKRINSYLKEHREQLLKYAFKHSVPIAVLTDGASWWFYLPTASGNWEAKIYDSVEIGRMQPEESAKLLYDYLSRENVVSGKAEKIAAERLKRKKMAYKARVKIPEAWRMLLAEKKDLLELLKKKTAELAGAEPLDEDVNKFLLKLPANPDLGPSKLVSSSPSNGSIKALIAGQVVSKNSWRDLYLYALSKIEEYEPERFQRLKYFRRNNIAYFSDDPKQVAPAQLINRSGIYAKVLNREDYVKTLLKHCLKFLKFPSDLVEFLDDKEK